MDSNKRIADERLATFERQAIIEIARVARINATTPANGERASKELCGWKLRTASKLINKHGWTSADVRAAWDRASSAAREIVS